MEESTNGRLIRAFSISPGKENNKAQLPRNPNKPNNTNRVNDDRPVRRQVGPANGERSSLPNRRFGGGKREFDRQSGSDKTGIKAVDKRDGGGAHNWGSIKQQIDDSNKPDWESEQGKEKAQPIEGSDNNGNVQPANKEQNAEQVANNQTEDEEAKEITLDEWKAQRANRSKPQFNIRKAGEGEDTSQWKKMVALQSRKNKVIVNSLLCYLVSSPESAEAFFLRNVRHSKHGICFIFAQLKG